MANLIINGLEFNVPLLVKRFRQDLRDDWFPDALEYIDYLDSIEIQKSTKKYKRDGRLLYQAAPAQLVNIPKKGFTIRYGLEGVPQDRLIYQAIGTELLKSFDEYFADTVFSHRLNPEYDGKKYIFKHKVESWKRFEDSVRAEAEFIGEDGLILFTDLLNYFEMVQFDHLHNAIEDLIDEANFETEEIKRIRKLSRNLNRILEKWSPYQSQGVPQCRDTSSILGNLILRKVDHLMIDSGYSYFRYMDDIRIVCSSHDQARSALRDLTIFLREIGLNVNSKKTKIRNLSDALSKGDLIERDYELEKIESLYKTKKKTNIILAAVLIQSRFEEILTARDFDSRRFRACINRLERLARCEEFIDLIRFRDFNSALIDALYDFPHCTDSISKFLLVSNFTKREYGKLERLFLSSKCRVYPWQRYLLWLLFSKRGYSSATLVDEAKQMINDANSDSCEKAGAAIYLGACGGSKGRIAVTRAFRYFRDCLSQRAGLIAVHELSFEKHIKAKVAPYVLPELKGTYKRLRTKTNGVYVTEPISIKASELYSPEEFGGTSS